MGGVATDGGNWKVATGLAIYCAVVVSGIDNVIKPFVLHGQANLHPLLALLSILGGIQVLGPVGILVGPMLVSFLQALLAMFRKELERWEDPTQRSLALSPGAQALAEHDRSRRRSGRRRGRDARSSPDEACQRRTRPRKRPLDRPSRASDLSSRFARFWLRMTGGRAVPRPVGHRILAGKDFAMNVASVALVVAALGVSFGWQPSAEDPQAYEVLMQVEPELVDVLHDGRQIPIESHVPASVTPIRNIRVVVGTDELPRTPIATKSDAKHNRSASSAARNRRRSSTPPDSKATTAGAAIATRRRPPAATGNSTSAARRSASSRFARPKPIPGRSTAHSRRPPTPEIRSAIRSNSGVQQVEPAGSATARQRSECRQRLRPAVAEHDRFRRPIDHVRHRLRRHRRRRELDRRESLAGTAAAGLAAIDVAGSPVERRHRAGHHARLLVQHPARTRAAALGDATACRRRARGKQSVDATVRRPLVPAAAGRRRSAAQLARRHRRRQQSAAEQDWSSVWGTNSTPSTRTQRRCGRRTRARAAAVRDTAGSATPATVAAESDHPAAADASTATVSQPSSSAAAGSEQWGRRVGEFRSAAEQQFRLARPAIRRRQSQPSLASPPQNPAVRSAATRRRSACSHRPRNRRRSPRRRKCRGNRCWA